MKVIAKSRYSGKTHDIIEEFLRDPDNSMILTPYYHSMRIIVDRLIDKGLSPDDARQYVKVVDISMRIDPKVKILIDDADLLLKSLFGSVKCISVDNSVRCPICCGVCKKTRASFYECINCGTIFEELKNGDLSKIADRV